MLFTVNKYGDNEYDAPLAVNALKKFLAILITSPAAGVDVNVTVVKPAFTV
jgi:hypothetical protein